MTLNVNSPLCRHMRVATKRLRLESHRFRYEVALYLRYLQIEFDDQIKLGSSHTIISVSSRYGFFSEKDPLLNFYVYFVVYSVLGLQA